MDEKFSYCSSSIAVILTLLFERALLWLSPQLEYRGQDIMVLSFSFIGMVTILILLKEVIFEYKNSLTTLIMFLTTIFQFIFFFSFQYRFLLLVSPGSFSGFAGLPVDFLLQSTLIFLFNPTIIPLTEVARALVLINLFGSMVIIMFVLQNIWYFKDGGIYKVK
jgi:hypothetical protein